MDEDPLGFVATLDAAKRGDEAAFARLFRATQPALLRYLRVVAGSRCEDLAGDTWVQVVRGLGGFTAEEPAAFRGWVLTIARHRWLDDQRARARRPEIVVDAVPDRGDGGGMADATLDLLTTEAAVALIAQLPREQAEVVFLRYVADLDVAETAELTGKTVGSVRVVAHRGLKRLRTLLSQQHNLRQGVTPEAT
ncbi:MAG TPA: RNA polymerase sigma factor [Mycobacteriales bacterium]|nr:RNA polymerase sigma factor [Mycobacteriales bacterium]